MWGDFVKVLKIIGGIAGALLAVMGLMLIVASFAPESEGGELAGGMIFSMIGFFLCIFPGRRRKEKPIIRGKEKQYSVDDFLAEKNLIPDRRMPINSNVFREFIIFVNTKKFGVVFDAKGGGYGFSLWDFKQLSKFKVEEVKDSESSGVGVSVRVAKGVNVGTGRRQTRKYCDRIELRLTLNDVNTPSLVFPIMVGRVEINSPAYRVYKDEAERFVAVFNFIKTNK